jgi:hypothetical protein
MTTKTQTTKTARKAVPKRKVGGKAQYERFREFAREVEADDDPEAFDRKFRKVVPPKSPSL